MRKLLTRRNKKLNYRSITYHRKNNIPVIWSTSFTCPFNCKGCYSKDSRNRYSQVPAYRDWHKEQTETDCYVQALVSEIMKNYKEGDFIRLHGAEGEFYSEEYVRRIKTILSACKGIPFFTYTKKMELLRSIIPSASNLFVINSIMPDGSFNYGDQKFLDKWKKRGYIICPNTQGKAVKCCECLICTKYDKVIFKQHRG